MRRSAPPGAFGAPGQGSREVEPSPRKRKTSPSDARRKAERAEKRERRTLEAAVSEVHDIRNERNPLARRHLGEDAHVDPVELPGRDWTRAHRAGVVSLDVEAAYEAKRGEAR